MWDKRTRWPQHHVAVGRIRVSALVQGGWGLTASPELARSKRLREQQRLRSARTTPHSGPTTRSSPARMAAPAWHDSESGRMPPSSRETESPGRASSPRSSTEPSPKRPKSGSSRPLVARDHGDEGRGPRTLTLGTRPAGEAAWLRIHAAELSCRLLITVHALHEESERFLQITCERARRASGWDSVSGRGDDSVAARPRCAPDGGGV